MAPPASSMALKAEDLSRLREQYWQLAELALERPLSFHFFLDWEQGNGARRASGCGAGVEYVVDPAGRIFPAINLSGRSAGSWGMSFPA